MVFLGGAVLADNMKAREESWVTVVCAGAGARAGKAWAWRVDVLCNEWMEDCRSTVLINATWWIVLGKPVA